MTCCAVSTVSGVPSGGGGGGGEANTGANVGGATGEVFRNKTGVTLNFKTISGSGGIVITNNADTIDIDGSGISSDWATVLAAGNVSGGTDPVITHGDTIRGEAGGGGGIGIGGTLALVGGASTDPTEPGGPVNITGGTTAAGAGPDPAGAVNITGGTPLNDTGVGGAVNILGGTGNGTGNSAPVNIEGGPSAGGTAGAVNIDGGDGMVAVDGGDVVITGGPNPQGGFAASIRVEGAQSAVAGAVVEIFGGDSSGNRPAGDIHIQSGSKTDALNKTGDVLIETGTIPAPGATVGQQGDITIRVNEAGTGTDFAGDVNIIAGDSPDSAGINHAGDIRATTGTASVNGSAGDFIVELAEGITRSGRFMLTRPDAGPAIEIRYTPTDYDPEGVEFGNPGDIVNRTDGTAFIKESGVGTNTGWSQISTASGGGAPALADVLAAGNLTGGNDITISGGDAIVTANQALATDLDITAGNSTGSGNAGADVNVTAGNATAGNANGGSVVVTPGDLSGTGLDGDIILNTKGVRPLRIRDTDGGGGTRVVIEQIGGSINSQTITFQNGSLGAGTPAVIETIAATGSDDGPDFTIRAGDGGGTGDTDGGNIFLQPGQENASGAEGKVRFGLASGGTGIGLPNADGAAGQVLTTDGSLAMDFKTIRAQLVYTVVGTLTVNTDQAFALQPSQTLTIEEVRIVVKTAPTGASLIVDVNVNGTSIFNVTPANRPTITATNTEGTSGAPDTTALAKDDDITIDIDQIGSTVAGADLTVMVRCALIPDA